MWLRVAAQIRRRANDLRFGIRWADARTGERQRILLLNHVLNLESLQLAFATVDLQTKKPKNSRLEFLEILLLKKEPIKLKMYRELNHGRPHFHVDYGASNHSASYAVDTGERLDGSLPTKYDRAVAQWAVSNRVQLHSTWLELQGGKDGRKFIAALSALKS